MLLYPFIYPLNEPQLSQNSNYIIPYNSLMGYSRVDPSEALFYLPSKVIPGKPIGGEYYFKAYHSGNEGLYPALLVANHIYVTSNQSYGFTDVSSLLIAIRINNAGDSVDVAYIDVVTGELVILSGLELYISKLTEDSTLMSAELQTISRISANQYTGAVNNLPNAITCDDITITDEGVIYTPPPGTIYSYLTITINNPADSETVVLVQYTNVINSVMFTYHIKAKDKLVLQQIALFSDNIKLYNGGSTDILVHVGAMHMGGR